MRTSAVAGDPASTRRHRPASAGGRFGEQLRAWRLHRRLSQLDLGLLAGVSAKHLSYLETGRARPSPEMVLHLADHLEVPIRERNDLLVAAGHAPRYAETPLDDVELSAARRAIDMFLEHHRPYPALVVDRQWDLVAANDGMMALIGGVDPRLLGPPLNVLRLCLHPDGLAPRIRNLGEVALHLLERLQRQVERTADPQLADLLAELRGFDLPPTDGHVDAGGRVLLPVEVEVDGALLSMFTTVTTFGSPLDVTTSELTIESFFPADASTDAWFRDRGEV